MSRFPFIAQKLLNVPLAITPAKAEMLVAALSERMGLSAFVRAGGERVALKAAASAWSDDEHEESDSAPDTGYTVVSGVAVVPVYGTLVQKLGYIRPVCGMTGYDGIRLAVMRALADPAVEALMLDVDSPGGEVSGCFDLVDTLYQARGLKPMWAVLNESAYSAAYAIASACDRITVPRTGGTGSVGVICAHTDLSKALETAGVTVTLITFGARKADGASSKPLEDAALARFQSDVDTMGQLFVSAVARNRGMSENAVKKTQAGTYLGQEGVDVGFADQVLSPDAAFRALLKSLPKRK